MPKTKLRISLSDHNIAIVEFLLYSELRGKVPYNTWGKLINTLIERWSDQIMEQLTNTNTTENTNATPISLPDPSRLTPAERIAKINEYRARVNNKEIVSPQELRYAVDLVRLERATATSKKKDKGSSTPSAPPSLTDF